MTTRNSTRVLLGVLVISVFIAGSAIQVSAETMNYRFATWPIKWEQAPAFDFEGHIVWLQTRGAVYFFENGDVATVTISGTGDMANNKGPFSQYVTINFLDKSTIVIKSEGYFGGTAADLKSEILMGTGRFIGIKGTQKATAKYFPLEKGELSPRGYGEGSITYSLPPK